MPPPTPTLIDESVAKPGSPSEAYERNTWPELERLARDLPECGVHFQGTIKMNLHGSELVLTFARDIHLPTCEGSRNTSRRLV